MSASRTLLLAGFSLGAAVAVGIPNAAFADIGRGDGGGFGRHHRDGDIFVFLPIVLLIAFAIAAVVLWQRRPPTTPPSTPTFNAEAILAERLARGEISPDDYRQAVAVLRETRSKP